MQCFVITRLKQLAIRGGLFLTLHENTRAKSDNDLISVSLISVSLASMNHKTSLYSLSPMQKEAHRASF